MLRRRMLHRRMLRRPPLLLLLQLLLLLLAGVRPVGRSQSAMSACIMHAVVSGQASSKVGSFIALVPLRKIYEAGRRVILHHSSSNRRAVPPPPRYRVTACWPHFTIQIARKMVDLKRYGNWRKGFLVVPVLFSWASFPFFFCISCICVFY